MAAARKRVVENSGDGHDESYVDRAAREVQDAIEAEESGAAEASPDGDSRHVVNLEDDDGEDEAAAEPARRPETARDRRKNRYREAQERAEAAERRAAQLEEQANREKLRADAMALAMAGRAQQQQPEQDPLDEEIKRLLTDKDAVCDEYEALPNEQKSARHREFRDKLRDVELKISTTAARKALRGIPKPDPLPVQILNAHYSDVASHPQGVALVGNIFDRMRIAGAPDSAETLHAAARQARSESPELRAKMSRTTGHTQLRAKLGHTSAGSRGAGPERSRRVVDLSGPNNRHHREIARSRWPDVPEEVAFKRYAREMVEEDD
jgi:hypothetical protein